MSSPTKLGRRKGFGVQLSKLHWWTVLLSYDYAREHGLNTPEMDEAAALIPDVRPTDDESREVMGGRDRWAYHVNGSKTVRFRAEQVPGAIQLLRLAAFLNPHGQAHGTIRRRARMLMEIPDLDLLADAGR